MIDPERPPGLLRQRVPELGVWIPRTVLFAELDAEQQRRLNGEKERWVIKPRQESRGRGVVCGAELDEEVSGDGDAGEGEVQPGADFQKEDGEEDGEAFAVVHDFI